jgi:hypothetical protein
LVVALGCLSVLPAAGFCTRNKSYFCAVDPRSDGGLQGR